jgi:hypothetical protein
VSEALELALAEVLRAPDPVAALDARAVADPALAALAQHVSRDGLRLAALLVARLRFERLVNGSREAERESNDHPEEFARAFRRYHAEVPPSAVFPAAEARTWDAWRRCR